MAIAIVEGKRGSHAGARRQERRRDGEGDRRTIARLIRRRGAEQRVGPRIGSSGIGMTGPGPIRRRRQQRFSFRDRIVLTAFSVVLGTLAIQGLTLKALLRALDLHEDDLAGREVRTKPDSCSRSLFPLNEHPH